VSRELWRSLSEPDVVAMLDRVTDGVAVLDSDWRFGYVNLPAAAMLRRPRDELLGRSIWSQFPDATAGEPFLQAFEEAVRDRRPVTHTGYYPPLGRWFESRCFPRDDTLLVLFRDITGRRMVEETLREYTDRMSEAERIAHFGVWRWELASGRVRWSDELHRIYGLAPGDFDGSVQRFISYLHPDDRERVWKQIDRAVATLEPFAFEERIVRPDGHQRVLYSQGRVIAGSDGTATALVGVCHDVTERSEAERALGESKRRLRAIIDNTPSIVSVKSLDGRYVMANAECARILGMSPRDILGQPCSVLFPEISDQMLANDHRAVAEREPVYDETVLVRDGEKRTYVTATFALPDAAGRAIETCTIGTDVTERRQRESERQERREWAHRIDSALREDRMLVYAQPVVDVASGEAEGYELLARLQPADETQPIMEPAEFLPEAERFGLIQSVDTWMVGQALGLAERFAPRVNLSAITLCDADARTEIVGLLSAAPEAARRIVFEITETATAEVLEAAASFATELTTLGCGLALDDFGTGFGSFTYLRVLPLRYLKIDRSFVTGLPDSLDDQHVVRSIIGIAEQFGLQTIAEGVEHARTVDLLTELGTHYAQGFHLGFPAPVGQTPRPAITAEAHRG
jgi:PAS domain S-box-containing protein